MITNLTIKSRLMFVISFLSLLLVGGDAIATIGNLSSANNPLRTIDDDRLIPNGQLNTIARLIDVNRMAVAELLTPALMPSKPASAHAVAVKAATPPGARAKPVVPAGAGDEWEEF